MKNKISAPTAKKLRVQVSESPVYETSNYSMFNKVVGNRPISQKNFTKLKSKIDSLNLLHCFPIVINKKYEVIDGQHRLSVAEDLDLPIYFIIEDDAGINATRQVNTVGQLWSQQDFMQNFIALEEEEYIKLSLFHKENKDLISLAEAIFLYSGKKGEKYTKFRQGELVQGCTVLRDDTIAFLRQVSEIRIDVGRDTYFQRIIYFLLDQEVASMSRLLTMFQKYPEKLMYLPKSEAKMFGYIEEIYNKGLTNYISIRQKKKKFKVREPKQVTLKPEPTSRLKEQPELTL